MEIKNNLLLFSLQPKKNHNPWAFLYFVSFLLIAGFVVINMVVGVIIDNFQKCRILVEEEIGIDDNNNRQRSESGMSYFENSSLTIKLITRNKKVFTA